MTITTLEMLVWLLQVHKQVRVERLAALLPLPILSESRRRHLQRFLLLPQLSISLVWLPIIEKLLRGKIKPKTRLYVVLDRTQWKTNNVFVVALIWQRKEQLPLIGSENTEEKQKNKAGIC